ncbi:MAG: DUF1501 domain-containing protein [Verrucomicrobia bacterium]|nr:DUF1501 domain-containing protein [Verrucomicrobiota bacterium]
MEFSPKGRLIAGGFTTNRQWTVRGTEPLAIQRIDWNGVVPFEIKEINIKKDGFLITFTKSVDKHVATRNNSYNITTYTHIYHAGYGSPEVDQTTARVTQAVPSADGLSVFVHLEKVTEYHIHDFDLARMTSPDGHPLVHNKAYYTVNEMPRDLSATSSQPMPVDLRRVWGDQFSSHSQGDSGFRQIFRQVLDCGNGACAVAAFDMEQSGLELSRTHGLAEAKAVNRSARHRSPRRSRVHRRLAKFYNSGCCSCWQRFMWNISALSRFTEEGQHEFRPVAPWSLFRLVGFLPWTISQESFQENKISAYSVTECRPTERNGSRRVLSGRNAEVGFVLIRRCAPNEAILDITIEKPPRIPSNSVTGMLFNQHENAFRRAVSQLSRRDFLNRLGAGMGSIGLAGLLGESRARGSIADSPLFPKVPHFAPQAKHVIQLFVHGEPSEVDTFDYKPLLAKHAGERPEMVNRTAVKQTIKHTSSIPL